MTEKCKAFFIKFFNSFLFQTLCSVCWSSKSPYMKKYYEEYSGKKWSQEEHTQNALKAEVDDFFKVVNDYMTIVKENNDKLVRVLNDNYTTESG